MPQMATTKRKYRSSLTPEQRRLSAQLAAASRWSKYYARRTDETTSTRERARLMFQQSREED